MLFTALLTNGYPLVFPDSGTYIHQALKLQGGIGRPPFYSLFTLPLHLGISLWAILLNQDLITCYVIFRALTITFPKLTPPRCILVIVLTGCLTSLPWFSNQIMPDIVTPLIVFLIFCLCIGWEQLTRVERLGMPMMLLVMISFHQASTIFALLVLGAALVLAWRDGTSRHTLYCTALLVAVPIALAVLGQSAYGYAVIKRFTPSPAAPFFTLARLLDDGPARRYLAQACPAAGYTLCRYQDAIHGDNNVFLWQPDSPLQDLIGERGEIGALDEAAAIVANTIGTYPVAVLMHAVGTAMSQLITTSTTDVNCPCLTGKINKVMTELFPNEYAAYASSLQNRGDLPWPVLAWIDGVVLVGSAVFLAILQLARPRALAGNAGRLLALITWAYVANAGLMGALSGSTDRDQARIAWLVPPFPIALIFSDLKFRMQPIGTSDPRVQEIA